MEVARYTYHPFKLRTGDVLGQIDLTGATLRWAINDPGDMGSPTADVYALEPAQRSAVREMTEPWLCGIAAARNDVPVWAGIITSRRYSGGGRYTLTVPGLLAYWAQARIIAENLQWDSIDQFDLVRALFNTGPAQTIPIDLGNEVSGVVRQRTIAGSDLSPVLTEILNIADNINGFEIASQTSWRVFGATQGVQHRLLLGSPRLGRSEAGTGLLLEQPGNASGMTWDEDGDGFATHFYGSSSTDDGVSLVKSASNAYLLDQGYPAVMRSQSFDNISVVQTLVDHVRESLARAQYWSNSPTLTVPDRGETAVGNWMVGDEIRVRITDDMRFPRSPGVVAPGMETTLRLTDASVDPSSGQINMTMAAKVEAA